MPIARYQLEDGRVARFEVPEGTSPEQAQTLGSEFFAAQQQPAQQAVQPAPQEQGFFDQAIDVVKGVPQELIGGGESALAFASGIPATVASGFAGLTQAANPFAEEGAGEQAVKHVGEALTFKPRTKEGKRGLESVAGGIEEITKAANIPIAGLSGLFDLVAGKSVGEASKTIEGIRKQGASKFVGKGAFQATGSPALATAAELIPIAAASLIGIRGAGNASIPKNIKPTVAMVDEPVIAGKAAAKAAEKPDSWLFRFETPSKKKVREAIESGQDAETARYVITGTDKIKKRKIGTDAIKQGVDEGVVASVVGSSAVDKAVYSQMFKTVEKGLGNKLFRETNRPADAIGKSLQARWDSAKSINSTAGKELDNIARGLHGQKVDTTLSVNTFIDDLDNIGVTMSDEFVPNFTGSTIEGSSAAESLITKIAARLKGVSEGKDAFNAHRMKGFIDEQVSFGKAGQGLTGKSERITKKLRHNINESIRDISGPYKDVNTRFAESISALDDFSAAVGSKFDPLSKNADKFLGGAARKLLSNQQSRITLIDAISDLEAVSKKHGAKFSDNINAQAMVASELERLFGSFAGQSLQGVTEKAISATAKKVRAIDVIDTGVGVAASVIEKTKGINQRNLIKSLKALTKEQK